MRFIPNAIEAQLHKEVYISILNSWLIHGEKKKVAEKAGITPNYLSNILNIDHNPPSEKIAQRIVEAIPAPSETKKELLEHMLLANEQNLSTQQALRSFAVDVSNTELVDEISKIHLEATFASSPQTARQKYELCRMMINEALKHVIPEIYPLAYIKLSLILHDIESILNHPEKALWRIKTARYVMESVDISSHRRDRENFTHLSVNTIYAEAISYQSMKLYNNAIELYELADDRVHRYEEQIDFWLPAIYRGKIISYSNNQRFSIRRLKKLAYEAQNILSRGDTRVGSMTMLLIPTAIGQAYLRRGNYKKAEKLLSSKYDDIKDKPMIGPLHKVTFLKTFAQVFLAQNDTLNSQALINIAYDLATQAGLQREIFLLNDIQRRIDHRRTA